MSTYALNHTIRGIFPSITDFMLPFESFLTNKDKISQFQHSAFHILIILIFRLRLKTYLLDIVLTFAIASVALHKLAVCIKYR